MVHEQTGFDLDNNNQLKEDARSSDIAVSLPAVAALKKLASEFGPNLQQQNEIVRNFHTASGNSNQNKVLQACAVCGRSDYTRYLRAEWKQVNESWFSTTMRLSPEEVTKYKQSRVEGYFNLTVMEYLAVENKQSLAWAYKELYTIPTATDAIFKAIRSNT